MKKKKKGFLSCINGGKGAISLFLAVLMTPFLTIAMLLVETGRYNQAVSLIDEAMGASSLSLLADYDKYLQDRWGLYAVNQQSDWMEDFSTSLEFNLGAGGSAIRNKYTYVEGKYALSNKDVMMNQLMEYCKLNVPATLGYLALDKLKISDLIDKITGMTEDGKKITSLLTNSVNALDSGLTLIETQEKLQEVSRELDGLKSEYETDYTNFKEKTNALIDLLVEKSELQKDKEELDGELSQLNSELAALKNSNNPDEDAISDKEKEISDKEAELRGVESEISTINNKISSARSKAASAKTEYADVLSRIEEKLVEFQDLIGDVNDAVDSIQKSIIDTTSNIISLEKSCAEKQKNLEEKQKALKAKQKEIDEYGYVGDTYYQELLSDKAKMEAEIETIQQELAPMETDLAILKSSSQGLGTLTDDWDNSFASFSEEKLGDAISKFRTMISNVNALDMSAVTKSTPKITDEKYHSIPISGYIAADEIEKYFDKQEEEIRTGSLMGLLEGLINIYTTIMGMSIFVEADLDSVIDVEYYEQNVGGLLDTNTGNGILEVFSNLGKVTSGSATLLNEISRIRLKKAWETFKTLIQDTLSLIESVFNMIKNLLGMIADFFTSYERLYLATYCAYNLGCRTDYKTTGDILGGKTSFKTMTNYSVGEASFQDTGDNPQAPVFGEITAIVKTIQQSINNTGGDFTFSGAQLEYILFGSNSEVVNQLYTFLVIYFIRFIFNIPAISGSAEVQTLAASATLGYGVVMALYYILEPLVQTVLLVNGKSQDLVPTKVYLSPSGLPGLISELLSFCKMTSADEKSIKDKMIAGIAKSQDDYDYQAKLYEYQNENKGDSNKSGIMKLSYKEYCFIVSLLTVSNDDMYARLHNIIQMETLYYYKQTNKDFVFDLRNAYSFLHVEAQVEIDQILPSMIDSSRFTVMRELYRGY